MGTVGGRFLSEPKACPHCKRRLDRIRDPLPEGALETLGDLDLDVKDATWHKEMDALDAARREKKHAFWSHRINVEMVHRLTLQGVPIEEIARRGYKTVAKIEALLKEPRP
jgi:hypothetical protein